MGVVSSLFGPALTQGQYRDNYLKDSMITPQQMMGRSLDDKIFAIGSNAGGMLGYGVGKLLGGQTPEEAQNEQMRGMLGGVNMNDPESLFAAAQNIQGVNPAAAQALVAQATDLQTKQATQQKTLAETKAKQAETEMKQVAYTNRFRALKTKFPEMSDAEAQGLALDEVAFREFFKESKIKYSSDVEEISAELFGKPFNQLSPAQAGQVNKLKEQRGVKKASAGASRIVNNLPKTSGDIIGFRKELNTVVKPFRDAVNAADQAIVLADNAMQTGNFAAASSLARSLAKASGEEQLSREDVKAFGGDPSLVGSVSDAVSRLATGTVTNDTLRQLKSLAVILKNKNSGLERQELEKMQNLARASGNYSDAEINEVFDNRVRAPRGGGNFPNAPAVGTVKNGYRYNGGDPAQQTSWSKQ
jgi:hypothetical protein